MYACVLIMQGQVHIHAHPHTGEHMCAHTTHALTNTHAHRLTQYNRKIHIQHVRIHATYTCTAHNTHRRKIAHIQYPHASMCVAVLLTRLSLPLAPFVCRSYLLTSTPSYSCWHGTLPPLHMLSTSPLSQKSMKSWQPGVCQLCSS